MTDKVLFSQPGLPVFQNKFYATREAACAATTGDVELVQDEESGLVYNRLFNPSLMVYDASYQNEQAMSAAFQHHLEDVTAILVRNFGSKKEGIEIGCGKGFFFEKLLDSGLNLTGYDPAYEGDNPRIVKRRVGNDLVAAPDYVILRHVLEHMTAPLEFLENLRSQAHPHTRIYIEAPCFDWIVENRAFYGIFYEHPTYFTLDFFKNAFTVVECGHFFGGQYLYVVADLASFDIPGSFVGKRYGELNIGSYVDDLLAKRRCLDGKTFVWGAGAKGTTFSNIVSKRGVLIDAIVDISPAKQQKFAGVTGTRIVAPEACQGQLSNADVYVMNPVYLDEIKQLAGDVEANWISVT